MNSLASSGLITMDDFSCIESTEAGRLMSLFYMDVETMKNIMKIQGSETLERLLCIVCESHEFADMHLRVDERRCLNLLNRNNKAATIRFPMKEKISTRQMKLNCIIQATLGCLPIPEPALNQEALKVMRTASRVCKCLVKYVTRPELPPQPQTFSAVLNSIILSKCIEAHLWENSPYVSKQLKGIGPTFSTLLASAGVTSFMLLEESHPRDLERIMNKGPPAGNIIRKQVSLLPKYQLTVTPIDARSVTIQLMLLNHNHLSENMDQLTAGDNHKSYLIVGDSENYLLLLTQFTDKDFISVYDGTMKYEVTRKLQNEHKILIHCVSSVIVGIDVQADYLFLDLEPQAPRENDHALWSNSNTPRPNIASKQTAITDVYKERKRKNENDITQCKEKKKREYTLTQKLKALKESFSKTSKTLKTDIDKSVETSNKVIHDLLDGRNRPRFPENNQVIIEAAKEFPRVDLTKGITDGSNNRPSFSENSLVVEYPTVDLTKNVGADKFEEFTINDNYDYIDDSQINSILSKIESEMTSNDPISTNMQYNIIPETNVSKEPNNVNSNARPMSEAQKVEFKYRNMNNTQNLRNKSSRSAKDFNKRKMFKSNFSVIDLIETKANIADDNIEKNSDKSIDSGFSDAIKSQINKFLQRAQNTTKPKMPVIDQLLDNSVAGELPEVFVNGYRQENTSTTCSKSNNEVQCREIKIQAKDMPQDVDKYVQPDVNDENYNFDENLDLPEVNLKSVQFEESNKYERKDDQTFDNGTVEYDKMDISDNLQEINKPDDSNDFKAVYPTVPLNTNLKHMPIRNQNLALTSNITRDKTIPVNPLQTTRMNESKEEHFKSEKVNVNPVLTLKLNQYAENQADTISNGLSKSDQKNIIFNKMDIQENETIKGSNSCDQSLDMITPLNTNLERNPVTLNHDSPMKIVQTLETNKSADFGLAEVSDKILATFQPVGLNNYDQKIMNSNQMDMHSRQESNTPSQRIDYGQTAFKHSKESLKNIAHDISNVNSLETITKPNYTNNALIPYNCSVETIGKSHSQRPTKLKSFIPYSDYQNTYGQDINDLLIDKMMNQSNHQCGPSDYGVNSANLVLTDQMRGIDRSNDLVSRFNLKPLRNNENLTRNINQPCDFYNASSIGNKNACPSDTKQVKQEKHENFNNQNETYFKRFSYTATKVDVCTKKYAPDHELRITRKLKLDVDVTEIMKQDNTNQTNEGFNGETYEGHDDRKPKQNNENVFENITAENMTNENEQTNDDDIIVIDKPDIHKNSNARKSIQKSIEDKPKFSATNNSIGNILQKYSKILVKPETSTPSFNKINKKADTTSAKAIEHTIPKSRKPFKITDINGVEMPLSLDITNKPLVNSSQIEPVATAKRIKLETKENIELYKPEDINLTPKTNFHNKTVDNKSFESPVSAHSLKLDSIEDIKNENIFNPKQDMKDESMFNPKLLLQYCTETNEDTNIIAPPADFSDNAPIYSPIASQEITSLYNNDDQTENMEDNFNSAAFESDLPSPPQEMETWCLSKDDETYQSPMRSAPWVISQRAHTNFGARRDKLCQFKFVRKKTYKPK
ncbi:protein PF3D7_1417600-like [Cydia splendana]|uniref:protein PF3D7_1417600-like n=1 Tax=Cydia splendana TaxID=1100963 RepID=UPI00300D3A0B